MAGNVVSNVKKYYGGQVPVPGQGDSDGKVKVLVEKTATIEIGGVQTEVELLYDADDLTTPVTPQQLGQWTDENYLIAFKKRDDNGRVRGFILYALETDSTSTDTLVNRAEFIAFKEDMTGDPGASAYEFTMVEDSSTLARYLRDENGEMVVKFNQATVEAGAQSGTLHELIDTDSSALYFEVVHEDGKSYLRLNTEGLDGILDDMDADIQYIIDAIDELPSDEHGYFNSSLVQTPGDGTTENIVIDDFRISQGRDVHGESIEFVPTHQEGGIDFGEVYLNPGTYIFTVHYTLQWVGNPRGTFLPLVTNVGDRPFDFSYEHEDVVRTTRIVTRTTRGKFSLGFPIDADTPQMGIWAKNLEIAQIASYNHAAVAHDTTLTGTGKLDSPLGVTPAAFGKVKDIPTSISQFRANDVIPVDGPNGPAKMGKNNLLTETAQNALAGNVAPAFDPTRDEAHKYLAGESVVYNGKTYAFKVDHYGAWANADVYADSIQSKLHNMFMRLLYSEEISFELGDITSMSATGWNYSNSTTRVRTAVNHFIPLDVGDKIILKYPGRVRMYVLAHNLDGTTTLSGWLTEDFVASKKCNAAILIAGGIDSNLSTIPDGVSLYEYYSSCVSVVIGGKYFAFSQNVLSRLNMVERDVSRRIVLTADFFELGNISISNSGWYYSASSERIRLKQGLTLVMDKGDSVVFGTTVSRYIGIRNIETGEYSYVGWIFSTGITEFVAKFKCEVVVLFETNDFAEVGNFCVNPYTYGSLVKKYVDFVMNGTYPLVNVSSDFFENGTINVDGASPYYTSYLAESRIRTKYGMVLEFRKDEIIHFDNVSHNKFIGVINKSGVLTRVILDSSTSDYVFTYDAYAVFFVDFGSVVTPKDLNGVYVSPGVMQRGYVKWNDFCSELIYLSRLSYVDSLFPSGVAGVAHRGYSSTAPENTMPAFKKAVTEGFRSIETDVRLTSDGVFVLLHDDTIDRTSDGSGSIDQMTYTEAMQYDFGSWKSSEYAGTRICRLDDFLDFCAMTKVFPFLEIKFAQTVANTNAFISLLKDKCFWGKCVIFGGSTVYKNAIISKEHPENMVQPIGFFVDSFTIDGEYTSSSLVNDMIDWSKKGYAVMALFDVSVITDTMSNFLTRKNIFVDVYTVDSTSGIVALPKSTKFVTSDIYEASKVWKDVAMS